MRPTAEGIAELEARGLVDVAKDFVSAHGSSLEQLFGGSRERQDCAARFAFAAWLVGELGWSGAGTARLLGRDNRSIAYALRKCGVVSQHRGGRPQKVRVAT